MRKSRLNSFAIVSAIVAVLVWVPERAFAQAATTATMAGSGDEDNNGDTGSDRNRLAQPGFEDDPAIPHFVPGTPAGQRFPGSGKGLKTRLMIVNGSGNCPTDYPERVPSILDCVRLD